MNQRYDDYALLHVIHDVFYDLKIIEAELYARLADKREAQQLKDQWADEEAKKHESVNHK